jgi:hypothetical protein
MALIDYANELIERLRSDAAINHQDTGAEFKDQMFDLLREIGEFTEPISFWVGKEGKGRRLMRLDGYFVDEVDNRLSLIICDFIDSNEIVSLTNTQIDTLSKQVLNFVDETYNGDIAKYYDDADETIKLSRFIKVRLLNNSYNNDILKIKIYILTNKKLSDAVKKLKQGSFNNIPVELNMWTLDRFFETESRNNNEPISIDLKNDFNNEGIICVKTDIGSDLGFEAYMAVIPGKLLADIYIEHGSKVLEGNVRAFLGTSGKKSVNSGIKRTIKVNPNKFFIYNNGIATTAAHIDIEEKNGQCLITKIEDLQIINGGQTTASLAAVALKKIGDDNCSLEGVFVPMKLTVIGDRESVDEEGIRLYDKLVQDISRYANTQNPVKAADFFSNSPYHIIMEKMSKRYFAPPANGSPIPTGWYYERARKKYNQEQIKMTPAEARKFQTKFPKKQVVDKTLLAKCIYCVECKPSIVARGANWIMKDFGAAIEEAYKKDNSIFNEFYFKKCISSVIIFKEVDSLVAKAEWYPKGGYKLNIVPYSIAKIITSVPKGFAVDWNRIWQKQMLYPSFVREVERVTKMTNEFINQSGGMIVTEYCKQLSTWEKYKDFSFELSLEFISDLVDINEVKDEQYRAKKEQRFSNNIDAEIEVTNLGAPFWRHLLEEGEKRNLLNYKEIGLLKVAASIDTPRPMMPSTAQAKLILAIKQKLDDEGIL